MILLFKMLSICDKTVLMLMFENISVIPFLKIVQQKCIDRLTPIKPVSTERLST